MPSGIGCLFVRNYSMKKARFLLSLLLLLLLPLGGLAAEKLPAPVPDFTDFSGVLGEASPNPYKLLRLDFDGSGLVTLKDATLSLAVASGAAPFTPAMNKISLSFKQTQVALSADDPSHKEGRFGSYARWYSTDYLPVEDTYAYAYQLAGHLYLQSVSYYTADKKYISGVGTKSTSGCATLRGVSVVPEGAAYVRFLNFADDGYPVAFKDGKVFALPTERDYNLYRRDHPLQGYTVACLGDSLTDGDYGLVVGAACVHYKNYPWFLEEKLGCTTLNFGRCGITVEGYCGFLHGVDLSEADMILVMLGTNAGINTANMKRKYDTLLKQIEKLRKPDAVVVLLTPPHATEIKGKPNYGYAPNVLSAVEYVRQYAAEKGYPLVDVYADSPIQEENEKKYQPNDGLHMAEKGYEALAEFLAGRLPALDPRLNI